MTVIPVSVSLSDASSLPSGDVIVPSAGASSSAIRDRPTAVSRSDPPESLTVTASRDDSVSDFKRSLQDAYGSTWGIMERKEDRDGVKVGWEVVHRDRVMSYHLFLDDYGMDHGDDVHVVIERRK